MKIAMIGHKRIPSREGGIEIVVERLSSLLASYGNEVVAYNRKGHHVSGKEYGEGGGVVLGVKLREVFTFQNSKLNAIVYSFLATLRAVFGRFDVIHYHAEGPAAMCFLPKLLCPRTKVVVTIHGLDWQRAKWGGFATKFLLFGEKTAAKYADRIIVLSSNVQQYFLDTYGRATVYIPNGIDRPEAAPAEIIKEKYQLEKDDYLLYLGRIVPEKRVDLLVEAYKKIETDTRLVIAGGSSHTDEYFEKVKELAKDDGRIIFTGFVEGKELEELYSNAYIYVLPSELEGMPLSLLEAMSYSDCCLTSAIPECTEVCEDRAEYFERFDADCLADKLIDMINNENLVSRRKSEAADFICDKYNWDDIAQKTLKLYQGKR